MTLKRKNNHSKEIIVFRLIKNEVLHKILGFFGKKFKMADENHLGFDLKMNWNHKNSHTNGISVFKLVRK